MATAGGIAWRSKIFRSFGISVPPAFAYTETPQATGGFGLSLPISMSFTNTSNSTAAFSLSLPPQFTEQYPATASFNLSLTPAFVFTGTEKYNKSFSISLVPSFSFVGAEKYSRSYSIALTPTMSFTGTRNIPPVLFDAKASGHTAGGYSFTHTATAGAYVIVDVCTDRTDTIGVTYGGTSMSALGSVAHNNSSGYPSGATYRFGLANVSGGAQTVAVSSTNTSWSYSASISYTGVGSVGTTTTVYGSGTSLSQGPVTCPSNGLVVQSFGMGQAGSVLSSVSGETNRFNVFNADGQGVGLCIGDSSSTGTFSGTASSSGPWGGIATPLNPSP